MAISRRGFLGLASAAPAALLAGGFRLKSTRGESGQSIPDCLLMGSQTTRASSESFAGYRSALAESGVAFATSSNTACYLVTTRCIILPEVVFANAGEVEWLKERLQKGATVLLEAGSAFLNSTEFDFQKRLLKSGLGLNLHPAVNAWAGNGSSKESPYVDYEWPAAVKIRDFSRVIPVEGVGAETIAWFRGMPLAIMRRIGKGTLVFLGSPIGPHLLAGDKEAGRWLSQFCTLQLK